jgi:hypothetical protein
VRPRTAHDLQTSATRARLYKKDAARVGTVTSSGERLVAAADTSIGEANMARTTWHEDPAHALRIASGEGTFEAYQARPAAQSRPAVVDLREA